MFEKRDRERDRVLVGKWVTCKNGLGTWNNSACRVSHITYEDDDIRFHFDYAVDSGDFIQTQNPKYWRVRERGANPEILTLLEVRKFVKKSYINDFDNILLSRLSNDIYMASLNKGEVIISVEETPSVIVKQQKAIV